MKKQIKTLEKKLVLVRTQIRDLTGGPELRLVAGGITVPTGCQKSNDDGLKRS